MSQVHAIEQLVSAARRSATDWMLGGLGVSAAAASAGFAIYMVAIGPGAVSISGEFTLFRAWDRRPIAMTQTPAATQPDPVATLPPGSSPLSGAPVRLSRAEVDFMPTGSIARHPGPRLAGLASLPAASDSTAKRVPLHLDDFVVRDVFDGKAVVEARNKLRIVEPGSVLEDVGEVLAIRKRGGIWVVDTAGGTLSQ